MSNLFEVGMWVNDGRKGCVGQIKILGKETVELYYPTKYSTHGIWWDAWIWDIEFLTEQEQLQVMLDLL
jgi:hypothetical protein